MTRSGAYYAGFLEYEGLQGPGFLLPVYRRYKEDTYYTQIEGATGSLVLWRIETKKADLSGKSIPMKYDLTATKVVAFRDVEGRVHVGSPADLKPKFDKFVQLRPNEVAIHLQIAELCGSREERRLARARMTEVIRQESGRRAAAHFRDVSLGWAIFWRLLLLHSRSDVERDRFMTMRTALIRQFSVSLPLLLADKGWSSIAALLSASPEEIVRRFKAEIMVPTEEREEESEEPDTDEIEEGLAAAMSEISARTNPTERIAFLFQALLNRPDVGLMLLDRYRDYDQFVTYASQVLRARLDRRADFGGSDEAVIASLVPTLCGMVRTRYYERLALDLARSLGQFPLINQALSTYSKKAPKRVSSIREALFSILTGTSDAA